MLVGLHVPTNFQMYRQNSEKALLGAVAPPPPPLATLVRYTLVLATITWDEKLSRLRHGKHWKCTSAPTFDTPYPHSFHVYIPQSLTEGGSTLQKSWTSKIMKEIESWKWFLILYILRPPCNGTHSQSFWIVDLICGNYILWPQTLMQNLTSFVYIITLDFIYRGRGGGTMLPCPPPPPAPTTIEPGGT